MSGAELPLTIVFGILATAALFYTVYVAKKQNSLFPVALFLGSVLSMFCEPIVTMLGLCWYPRIGQITAFESFGRSIPLFVAFAYCFYFVPVIIHLITRFQQGIGKREYWSIIAGAAAFIVIYDYLGIYLGLWQYYGDAPITVHGFPLWWVPANLMVFVPVAIAMYFLRPYLTGPRVVFAVVLMAAQVVMFHTLSSLPAYIVLNMDVGQGIKLPGVIASMLMATGVLWFCSELVCKPKRESQADPAQTAPGKYA